MKNSIITGVLSLFLLSACSKTEQVRPVSDKSTELAAKYYLYPVTDSSAIMRLTKDSVLIIQHDKNFKRYYG